MLHACLPALFHSSQQVQKMRRPKTPSSIPCVLAYLLLRLGLVSAWGFQGIEDCSPSSCGQLHNITYPFRLKGDPDQCGRPGSDYELTCEGNRTAVMEFHSSSSKYYVQEISYEASTIRITDSRLASGACVLPSQNFTVFNDGEFGHYDYWASFVNCTRASRNQFYSPVPCLTRNNTNTFVYATNGSDIADLDPSCGFLAVIPTIGDLDMEKDIFEQLQQGFLLAWPSDTHRDRSWKSYASYCFQDASRQFVKDGQARSMIIRIKSPVSFEINFLKCLKHGKRLYQHSHAVINVAVALIVLLDIAAPLLVIALLGRFVLAPLSVLAFLGYEFWRTQAPPIDDVEKFLRNQQGLAPKRFGYTDIIAMTRHFKDKLGQGGFGSVYKGELAGCFPVAVKMLGNSKCNGDDFISEVSTLGRIHHVNIVRLVGFCSEGSNRALVYEYLPKGSLDKYIFSSNAADRRPFTWEKLNDIALGVARGIDYLHRGCDMRILHFDIKPHNILMDNHFNPKVSDFGLAKLYPKGYSMVSLSAARGTIGYIAPEQISRSFGVVSYKSDVYSFGMLLLEMAGGRRNVDPRAKNSSQIYYPSWIYDQLKQHPSWVYDQLKQQEAIETIDATAIGEVERKLSIVGLWCIQTKPSDRPSMSRVVEMLEADVQGLQMPPKPFFSSTPSSSIRESRVEPSSSTGLSIISEHDSLS